MTRVMYDSVDVDQIPRDASAVAGYIDGHWPTFNSLRRFKANRLSIAVSARHDAACLDVEPGDAHPDEAPDWVRRQLARGEARPVVYSSRDNLPAVIDALKHDGIKRGQVRLWSAHYGHGAHICSPATCGADFTADGTQWTDNALGRNLDESLLNDDFFPPAPSHRRLPRPHKPNVHPKVAGASAGAALGIAITAILKAAGVHIDPDLGAAISTLTGSLGGYLTPARRSP